MEIQNIEIKKLKPSVYNPRKISEEDMESLKQAIKEFGLVEPIVVNKDFAIIGGHQRVRAASGLGMAKVPCIMVDLDKRREKILNLALNRIVGTWDETKLSKLITEISKYDGDIKNLTGFRDFEMNQLLAEYQLELGVSEGENQIDFEDNEALKRIFDRREKVEVGVERPQVLVRKNKIAFYVETMEQWLKIRGVFRTSRQGELDIEKLMKLIGDENK